MAWPDPARGRAIWRGQTLPEGELHAGNWHYMWECVCVHLAHSEGTISSSSSVESEAARREIMHAGPRVWAYQRSDSEHRQLWIRPCRVVRCMRYTLSTCQSVSGSTDLMCSLLWRSANWSQKRNLIVGYKCDHCWSRHYLTSAVGMWWTVDPPSGNSIPTSQWFILTTLIPGYDGTWHFDKMDTLKLMLKWWVLQ